MIQHTNEAAQTTAVDQLKAIFVGRTCGGSVSVRRAWGAGDDPKPASHERSESLQAASQEGGSGRWWFGERHGDSLCPSSQAQRKTLAKGQETEARVGEPQE